VKALVIEADQAEARRLEQVPTQRGWASGLARDGREGFEAAGREELDLILLNLSLADLPAGQAEELIPRLRILQPAVKIMTLTAANTRELERRVRQHGIFYYLTKPVDLVVFDQLLAHLEQTQGARPVPTGGTGLTQAAPHGGENG
jgi:DNA-binding response OmpR family regulator